ncbi:hypothetical protein O6H91_03G095000 [Diphasiastrum complanatum]|uniref:Uncharacterized protein n=3 Tax=Diphasiastrum complanatum TaxID=34168 RepID=A0ACC2E9U8_DIPCM|nr:hypothetical protein O6H91_03G095000 [Diphasiastrum complanatum]KAJ7563055.1 hypothetical protein O6H91_03G095000 [Diphasiastrum complanatum]KAJ7563057.1 hypothetical protein O6H91_03G095000 [Diphasiastrum complanatum]
MDEFIPDDCKRLFFGTSLFSSASADISSIFDVDQTHPPPPPPPARPNTNTTPSFGLEEWMFEEEEEEEEEAAARMDIEDHPVSSICGDLCQDQLQLELNCTVDSLLAGEDEIVYSHDHHLSLPSTSFASFDYSPHVDAVNSSSSFNIKSDPQEASSSSGLTANANLPDLNKIIVNKPILDKAVERLGGGANGAQRLWELIQFWLKLRNASPSLELPFLSNFATNLAAALPNSLEKMLFQESDDHVENAASFEAIRPAMDASPITVPIIVQGESVGLGTSATATASAACESPMMIFPNMCASRAVCSATAATTRAARKHRMARQRRSHHQARPASSSPRPGFATLQASGACHDSVFHDRKGLGFERGLRLFLCKELKPSDLGSLGRIVLPKKESESYLPNLTTSEGVPIAMEDTTSSQMWNFRYRFWPNNKNRMYLLDNTGDFVKSHSLEEGDTMMLYKDCVSGKYVIGGRKVARTQVQNTLPLKFPVSKTMKVREGTAANVESLDGLEISKHNQSLTPTSAMLQISEGTGLPEETFLEDMVQDFSCDYWE